MRVLCIGLFCSLLVAATSFAQVSGTTARINDFSSYTPSNPLFFNDSSRFARPIEVDSVAVPTTYPIWGRSRIVMRGSLGMYLQTHDAITKMITQSKLDSLLLTVQTGSGYTVAILNPTGDTLYRCTIGSGLSFSQTTLTLTSTGGSGGADGQDADSIAGERIDSLGRRVLSTLTAPVYNPDSSKYKHYQIGKWDTAGYGTAKANPAGKVVNYQSDGDLGVGTMAVTVQVYVANGLWSKPSGLYAARVICVGGGGGGATATAADESGGGGGGGGATISVFAASDLQSAESVYVAGAAAALATGASSWFGGISQTGAQLDIALGGAPGGVSGNTTTVGAVGLGGAGGIPTTGQTNVPGERGENGICYSASLSRGGQGGGSALGYGGGADGGGNAVGSNAGNYGGGGGGGGSGNGTDYAGGTGGPGIVIVYEYKLIP